MASLPVDEAFRRLFDPQSISADTHAVNERLMALLARYEAPANLAALRDDYASGRAGLPVFPKAPHARRMIIPGPRGDIALRILVPDEVRGAYLHIHGGGWMLGTTDTQDNLLELVGSAAGLAAVSVDYRLSPEHPYPAPLDDCVAAAAWLIDHARQEFGTSWLAIGGESAGANLAASTLIRLRDRGYKQAYRAANLTFGCFDLSLTPSMRRAKGTAFIDRMRMEQMGAAYSGTVDQRDPGISPLYADLADLPPALFTVGTIDPLVDDTLFMHMRWAAAGNHAQLAAYPGGVHGFTLLGSEIAEEANQKIGRFLSNARNLP